MSAAAVEEGPAKRKSRSEILAGQFDDMWLEEILMHSSYNSSPSIRRLSSSLTLLKFSKIVSRGFLPSILSLIALCTHYATQSVR